MNSPSHKKVESFKEPDLRSTLYWNPDVTIQAGKSAGISFYNDDMPHKVKVIVQGVSQNGKPVFSISSCEVTEP